MNERIVGATHEREAVEEWALVLAAAEIEHRVEESPVGWRLLVSADVAAEAAAALAAYERDGHESRSDALESGRSWIGLWLAGLILALHAVADPGWVAAGRATASRILAGEAWRTVTALGLHQDLTHLVGNAAAIALFATFLGRSLGPGLAVAMLLMAGAGGNGLSAVLRGPGHSSVGASTAIFGALGILGGLEFVRRRRMRPRGRAWLPIAGTLALLGLLGTSERADLSAHLLGCVVGTLLGALVAATLRRAPGRLVQGTLLLASAAVFAGCWALALGS